MQQSGLQCSEEVAYKKIKQRILDGTLAPGARLVHRVLAKEFGMSPNPVVLALRMLERDGLIVNTPGLGARIRLWNRDEIEDLYRIRALQEALAARLCATRAGQDEINSIKTANEMFKKGIDEEDVEANIQADVALHLSIVAGAHCPDLQRVIENLSIMQCSMKAFGMRLGTAREMSSHVRDMHEPLVQAIAAGEAGLAERLAREHVETSLEKSMPWITEVAKALEE